MRYDGLLSCALAILTAGIFAGCSDSSDSPSSPSANQQTYRGVFVGTSEAGAVSLTLTPTAPWLSAVRLLAPNARGAKGVISGVLSFDGVASHSVSGTYDTSNDSIAFTAGGATFYGTLDSDVFPARLVGRMLGIHSGILHCVPDDGTVVVHCGLGAYLGRVGFLTMGNEVAGGVITQFAVYPYYGYEIMGTMDDGDPLRPLTASGATGLDSLALSGYVDTAIDTAGGSWDVIPRSSGTPVSGSWHTAAIGPYGIEVARKSLR
jgi:hypothetical protein